MDCSTHCSLRADMACSCSYCCTHEWRTEDRNKTLQKTERCTVLNLSLSVVLFVCLSPARLCVCVVCGACVCVRACVSACVRACACVHCKRAYTTARQSVAVKGDTQNLAVDRCVSKMGSRKAPELIAWARRFELQPRDQTGRCTECNWQSQHATCHAPSHTHIHTHTCARTHTSTHARTPTHKASNDNAKWTCQRPPLPTSPARLPNSSLCRVGHAKRTQLASVKRAAAVTLCVL